MISRSKRNKEVFDNVHLRVKSALDNVESIQQCLNDLGSDQDPIEQEQKAQKELLFALNLEDELWREKSRINWHTKRDRNNNFFHKIAKIRYATKSLTMLRDGEDSQAQSNNLIQSVIPLLISDMDNSNLIKLPLPEEIKCGVLSLNGESAPRPDQFGDCFF
ncbi:hypothetical protein Lal_00012657 [Lupinus albus]|nr:hypothetical protein Lal_00012657 [Lupinus albus]